MALGQRGTSTKPPTEDRLAGSGPPAGPPSYNWRATLWLVVGMLVVVGAMGVFMRVIPTPFIQPAPTAFPTPRPTAQPVVSVPQATAAPTPGPYSLATLVASQPTAAPTTVPQAQPATGAAAVQPTAAPTSAPPAQPAAGQPTAVVTSAPTLQPTTAPTAEPTAHATAPPTVDPSIAAEILPAYQHYWEVLDDALATLDGSKLNDVMDGPELVGTQAYLNQLNSQNQALLGTEDHSITIVSATPEDAVIHDHVVDHSVVVDSTTREPLPPDQQQKQGAEIDGTYYLHKINSTWKVVGEG